MLPCAHAMSVFIERGRADSYDKAAKLAYFKNTAQLPCFIENYKTEM